MSRIQFFFHHLFLVCQGYSSFSTTYSLSVKVTVLFPPLVPCLSRLQFFFHNLFFVYHVKDVFLFPPLIPCLSCQGYSSFSTTYSLSIMSRMQSFFHHLFLVYHVKDTVLFHHLVLVYHVKDAVIIPPLGPCLSCLGCSSFSTTYSLSIMSRM